MCEGVDLLMGLSAVMLPYLLLICVAAQLTTMLYAAQHFTVPALAPAMLNIVWLIAALVVAPWFAPNQVAQAYVLAVAVLVAGVAQVAVQLPMLRRLGFHFDYNWSAAREGLMQIGRNMAPMLVGLAVTQINTFIDSLIAWGLAAAAGWAADDLLAGRSGPLSDAAGRRGRPLLRRSDSASFRLGIVGMAVAVAIFPLLSRHAARGDRRQLGADMTLGLRLVVVPGRAGRRGADPAGRADRAAAVPARTFRARRHVAGRAHDRLLRHRRLGVLCVAGGGAGLLRAQRLRHARPRGRLDGRPESGAEPDADLAAGRGGVGRIHLRGRGRAGVGADGDLLAPSSAAGLATAGRHGRAHDLCHPGDGRRRLRRR